MLEYQPNKKCNKTLQSKIDNFPTNLGTLYLCSQDSYYMIMIFCTSCRRVQNLSKVKNTFERFSDFYVSLIIIFSLKDIKCHATREFRLKVIIENGKNFV